FFFSSRRRHTRFSRDWSSDVCSSDLRTGGSDGISWGTGRRRLSRSSTGEAPPDGLDDPRRSRAVAIRGFERGQLCVYPLEVGEPGCSGLGYGIRLDEPGEGAEDLRPLRAPPRDDHRALVARYLCLNPAGVRDQEAGLGTERRELPVAQRLDHAEAGEELAEAEGLRSLLGSRVQGEHHGEVQRCELFEDCLVAVGVVDVLRSMDSGENELA